MAISAKALALAATLLLGSCAPSATPPRMITVYHCSETSVTPLGTLTADTGFVSWSRELDGGIRVQLTLSLYSEVQQAAFASRGFEGMEFDHPLTFFDFDRKYADLNWPPFGDGHTIAGQVRIGSQTVDAWMPINMTMAVSWRGVRRLMREPGDVLITLHDKKGTVLQQGRLPRDAWPEVEKALRAMHARVMERFSDKDRLCNPTQEEEAEEIVVT